MQLRKIAANDPAFLSTKEKHMNIFEDFKSYAEQLTIEAGKATKKSGKASSYARYLISTVVLYESIFNEVIDDLDSYEGVKKIEKITSLKDFKEFNNETNHFFSAAISCFSSYVVSKYNIEEKVDEVFNAIINDLDKVELDSKINTVSAITTAQKRKEKQINNGLKSYPRSEVESITAKEKSNWQCEIDSNHSTFINKKNNKPFVEGHHLIPMAAQSYFDNTIDFADNIVTLCPNCHRKIHFAVEAERKEMIKKLYEPRVNLYSGYGIEIDGKSLLKFNQIKL